MKSVKRERKRRTEEGKSESFHRQMVQYEPATPSPFRHHHRQFSVQVFACLFSTSSLHFHSTKSPSGTQAEVHEIKGIFTLKNIIVIICIHLHRLVTCFFVHNFAFINAYFICNHTFSFTNVLHHRWRHVSPSQIWHKIFSLTLGPLKVLYVKKRIN